MIINAPYLCLSWDATDGYHSLQSWYFLYTQSIKLSIAEYEKFAYILL